MAPVISVGLAPDPMTFGSPSNTVAVGTSPSQTETLTLTGNAQLALGTLSIGGPQAAVFSLSADTCSGQTVQPGGSCTVSVTYKPTAAGTDAAQLSVPESAPGVPQEVTLTGYAGAAGARATLSGSSVDFGQVTATHAGCRAMSGGNAARTSVYSVPPPVSNLLLQLRCPGLRRATSSISLRVKRFGNSTWVVTATVDGRRPQGVVDFAASGLRVVVPLDPDTETARVVLGRPARSVRARYPGDGYNSASSASERVS